MKEEWTELGNLNQKPKKKFNISNFKWNNKYLYVIVPVLVLFIIIIVSVGNNTQDVVPQVVCDDVTPFVDRNNELFADNLALNEEISRLETQKTEISDDRAKCKNDLLQAINNKTLQKCTNEFYITEIELTEAKLNKCLEELNSTDSNCWTDLEECNDNIINAIKELEK